ncbi:MAG: inositol monophosphatase [Blautia sp.]|nr:inositol monophosphatase [Blautia sp.]MCM1201377.1 inositol monophosphatase [Bacteroides fragilis]
MKKRDEIQVDALNGRDIKLSSDRLSEKIMMDILEESGIAVLSEEYGFKGEEGNRCWIIDPLDGTINYYKGMDEMACVSVALWKEDRPVLGVIYRFRMDELYYGEEGFGAYMNNMPIQPSDIQQTEAAVMAAGFPVKRAYDTESLSKFVKQVQFFKKVRMLGTAAIMSVFVACGKFDAYFEDEIMVWDVAAGVAIVNAAGGSTVLKLLQDNKVICKCFATKELMEDYYAKGL